MYRPDIMYFTVESYVITHKTRRNAVVGDISVCPVRFSMSDKNYKGSFWKNRLILRYSPLKDWESFQIFSSLSKSFPSVHHSFIYLIQQISIKYLLGGNCDKHLVGIFFFVFFVCTPSWRWVLCHAGVVLWQFFFAWGVSF